MVTTYKKLKSGFWGLQCRDVQAPLQAGDVVLVSKRDGSTKRETIGRVLWAGDDKAICSIARPVAEYREPADYVRDPGEDAADRWNETHGDRFAS